MKTITVILFGAAASLASTAFADWEGSSYINDTSETVNIGFGADATINPYHDPENVGVNIFMSVEPGEEVYCPPLVLSEVEAQYSWLGIDYTLINAIYPYFP